MPYRVVGGTKFYDRREVKDVMAYLRVLVNPDDEVSWRRIVNVPKRGVGETAVAKLAGWAGCHGVSFGEAVARAEEAGVRAKAASGLADLSVLLDELRAEMALPAPLPADDGFGPSRRPRPGTGEPGPSTDEVVTGVPRPRRAWSSAVVERTGYRNELLADGTIEALGRVENIDELVGVAGEYRDAGRVPRGGLTGQPTPTSSTPTARPSR